MYGKKEVFWLRYISMKRHRKDLFFGKWDKLILLYQQGNFRSTKMSRQCPYNFLDVIIMYMQGSGLNFYLVMQGAAIKCIINNLQ